MVSLATRVVSDEMTVENVESIAECVFRMLSDHNFAVAFVDICQGWQSALVLYTDVKLTDLHAYTTGTWEDGFSLSMQNHDGIFSILVPVFPLGGGLTHYDFKGNSFAVRVHPAKGLDKSSKSIWHYLSPEPYLFTITLQ
ncbi:hypothetical protein A2801_01640 [Candidatus Woesebacteria bacterium RIFCSPHIGHO2_01_FULL_41_10]|uniref:Uncharacterized protein n=1 Tax=Candidatus Woesebacteria bacterium RIFCSPHIGHO2_01_FULL_41_10 TaxID=1802500 RepID=A0A1F7YQC7_9BACT|nr:MAG: hypothetical protein A2801_01640 [Candidatus Woesebacteria bacterium RIFCSPHIGHO2_01_FULL_41_10]